MTEGMWIALISGGLALAGSLAGTLAGVALGARSARLQQQAEFDQQEAVRFHDLRVTTYAEYVGAANRVFAAITTEGRQEVADGAEMQRSFEQVRLIATVNVSAKASAVHAMLTTVMPPGGEPVTTEVLTRYGAAQAALVSAIREEIGVSSEHEGRIIADTVGLVLGQ